MGLGYVNELGLLWAMSQIETSGGGSVGGDANTRDFSGRDSARYNNTVNIDRHQHPHREHLSVEERLMDLEQIIYGEPRWHEVGMIKRQRTNLMISQINMVINCVNIIMLTWLVLHFIL